MTTAEYIQSINQRYILGNATEHTFRGDLQLLLESLVPTIRATNEPKRQKCGAPDYIITKGEIEIGYIEAKDIGDEDLLGVKKNKEQFHRYKEALPNLMFTDYLTFHIFRDTQLVASITIAEVVKGKIKPLTDNFATFESLIKDFCSHIGVTITNSKKLAKMMAGKARLLSDIIEKSLNSDTISQEDSTLKDQMAGFKEVLMHSITEKEFADVYAQTIAYGMFTARLHDPTLPTFSRQEAAELIPKSNPFLRKLFGYIAGPDLDDRIKWIVDSLIEIFLATNVEQLLKDYGKKTKMEDPIIHFYEDFLSEYDPKLRKARGVWYTPQPVVNFIVRAVDDILKSEFGITAGLADKSTITKRINNVETEFHKVQILDPATGTGTFLAATIKHIYKKFANQQGIWSNYVEQHLIPRLNGFEILMASYAMAHLKLDLLLNETGFKPTKQQRFKVFLTNSLEESDTDTGTIFTSWLSAEAKEANAVKRDTPVMCVIGNPPYSVSSNNKSDWILKLISEYKKDLNEVKINLDDDYIKFIRYGQHYIDRNGNGILAYISNNSFLDGITHRRMRESLLRSFNKVYIFNLHGNSRKKEVCKDGSPDNNVFDIMQGVSINIFIKNGNGNELAEVYNFSLQGKREDKYSILNEKNIKSIPWKKIQYDYPNYFFVEKDMSLLSEYDKNIKLNVLFKLIGSGMSSLRDKICIQFNKDELNTVLKDFKELSVKDISTKYNTSDSRDWKIEEAKKDILLNHSKDKYVKVFYRPFDIRVTFYTGTNKGFIGVPQRKIAENFLHDNIGLILPRLVVKEFNNIQVTKHIVEYSSGGANTAAETNVTPLYLYPDSKGQQRMGENVGRTPNLNLEIVQQIGQGIGLTFTNEKEATEGTFAPIDLLDYIYAVLHSPTYRERYKEFLKIDFPRVPYPKDANTFWQLVELGSQIRQLHLLESPILEENIIGYPIDGDNTVTKPQYTDGKVYINETQYFANVPQLAWEFYIGGYQPAQKWLKDRKNRTLEFEDIFHYQKIIIALTETHRLMQQIDNISFME